MFYFKLAICSEDLLQKAVPDISEYINIHAQLGKSFCPTDALCYGFKSITCCLQDPQQQQNLVRGTLEHKNFFILILLWQNSFRMKYTIPNYLGQFVTFIACCSNKSFEAACCFSGLVIQATCRNKLLLLYVFVECNLRTVSDCRQL